MLEYLEAPADTGMSDSGFWVNVGVYDYSAVQGVDPARRERLIKLLDIDLKWNLIRTSDGQRRRVQIALGLLREYRVLLMDEITVDLDVLSRLDLLEFFRQECEVGDQRIGAHMNCCLEVGHGRRVFVDVCASLCAM